MVLPGKAEGSDPPTCRLLRSKELRADEATRELPVLILTAKGQAQDRKTAEELGISLRTIYRKVDASAAAQETGALRKSDSED